MCGKGSLEQSTLTSLGMTGGTAVLRLVVDLPIYIPGGLCDPWRLFSVDYVICNPGGYLINM